MADRPVAEEEDGVASVAAHLVAEVAVAGLAAVEEAAMEDAEEEEEVGAAAVMEDVVAEEADAAA